MEIWPCLTWVFIRVLWLLSIAPSLRPSSCWGEGEGLSSSPCSARKPGVRNLSPERSALGHVGALDRGALKVADGSRWPGKD